MKEIPFFFQRDNGEMDQCAVVIQNDKIFLKYNGARCDFNLLRPNDAATAMKCLINYANSIPHSKPDDKTELEKAQASLKLMSKEYADLQENNFELRSQISRMIEKSREFYLAIAEDEDWND